MKPIKILVVEDESIVAEDIKDSLEGLGYTVVAITDSGNEAIEKAAATQPNLVLMDIRLKGKMDGVQAAEHIWNRFNIPIVYLTAHSDESTLQRAKITGSFGYITKPFRERELHTAVELSLYRHQLETKLKDREQWLDTILTSIGDAVIATDEKNRITLLNPAAEALTGWKQAEAIGKNSTEVFHIINEENRTLIDSPISKALQEGVVVGLPEQAILIAKNGTEIPVDDSAAPIKAHHGEITGVVLVFRDVTERKQAERSRLALARTQQLEMQMAELERLNRLKDDFLSTVSHELRTPMANIKMAIKMLESTIVKASGCVTKTAQPCLEFNSAARYLQILSDECGREIELINNLLDLQRLEAGVETLLLEIIDLQTWLPQMVKPFQERAEHRQQTLQVDIPADLPPIASDQASLERILAELLNNACKYTPPGESIMIAARYQQGILQLQVLNSGVEIPAHELPRIFDKFYRVPSSDPWKQGGTGLGLALVQKQIEHLAGCIQVESASGRTCFTVEIPVHSPQGVRGDLRGARKEEEIRDLGLGTWQEEGARGLELRIRE